MAGYTSFITIRSFAFTGKNLGCTETDSVRQTLLELGIRVDLRDERARHMIDFGLAHLFEEIDVDQRQ
jgi:hypothetical protein